MNLIYRWLQWWRDRRRYRALITRTRNLTYNNEIQRRRRIG